MIPIQKVKDIIVRHDNLEKELSSGKVDTKLFAKKSKEYSNLGNIILIAKEYMNFENEKKGLEQILEDKNKNILTPNYSSENKNYDLFSGLIFGEYKYDDIIFNQDYLN